MRSDKFAINEMLRVNNMCLKEDEVQKRRQETAKAAVDRIIRETPRQISTEMYVRNVAFEAFAEGWNKKAEEIKGESSNLRAGSNYTANDDTFPSEIQFTNGRKVGIAFNGDRPYLTIGWRGEELEGGDEMTDELKEAVDRLKRTWAAIVADGYGTNTTLATVLTALERETARADRAEAALRSISLFSRRQRVLVHKYEGDKVTETIGPKSDDPNWDYVIQTCERAGFGGTILRAMEANND